MGISEDINWIKNDERGIGKVFLTVANKRGAGLRELHTLFGVEDWWPLKIHLRALVNRGLVTEVDGNYRLTEEGKKVFEGLKVIERVEQV